MHRSLIDFSKRHSLKPLDPQAMHCLQPLERMHALVHRERARSDRNSQPFTLILFRIHGCSSRDRAMLRLANTALHRSRITDDVGWFDHRTLAVLLPDTDSDGAWCYVNSVKEIMSVCCQRIIDVTVYTYPTNWNRREDDDQTPDSASGGHNGKPILTRAMQVQAGVSVAASELAMEQLFIRSLPLGKRLFDILSALLVLLVVSPFMLFAALAVWLTSPGPIIFRQQRAGLGGVPFTMYKFRSMYMDAEERMAELRQHNEAQGPVFKMKNDPRITSIGRFLRKTSIDELPQLFNVLKGEMSLVGPRPPIIKETYEYESWQCRRLEVTPGITCIWQVSGRSNVSFDQWMRMDTQYAFAMSIMTDLKILLKTIPAVLFGRGAH